MLMRISDHSPHRVLLLATYRSTPDAAGEAELELAADAAARLATSLDMPLVVLHIPGSGVAELPVLAGHAGALQPAPAGGAAWLASNSEQGDVVVVGAGLASSVPARSARAVVEQRGVTILAMSPAGVDGGDGLLTW